MAPVKMLSIFEYQLNAYQSTELLVEAHPCLANTKEKTRDDKETTFLTDLQLQQFVEYISLDFTKTS